MPVAEGGGVSWRRRPPTLLESRPVENVVGAETADNPSTAQIRTVQLYRASLANVIAVAAVLVSAGWSVL